MKNTPDVAPAPAVDSTGPVAEDNEALKQQWLLEYNQKQQQKKALPSASKQPYIMMVLIMIVLVTVSIVLLETFSPPTRDNSSTIAQIIGFAGTTLAALFAYQKAEDTHVLANSRLSELLEKVEESALLKGADEGRDKANKRNDMLSDKAKGETR